MSVNRRNLVVGSAAIAVGTLAPRVVRAQSATGPFKLEPLDYAYSAFAPYIDKKTMEIHHDLHHQTYVTNLNNAARDNAVLASMPLHDLLGWLGQLPESIRAIVRNNGGGHANHSMFWEIMGPGGGSPDGELLAAISRDFGAVEILQSRFNEAGLRLFGSGWVFVTIIGDGRLAIETRPNQDTPIMDGGRVLFGNDVWEHAYYLNYQNRRADYLKAWWNTVNWRAIANRYAAAKAGALTI